MLQFDQSFLDGRYVSLCQFEFLFEMINLVNLCRAGFGGDRGGQIEAFLSVGFAVL